MKTCTKCGEEKTLDEFRKSERWYRSSCKRCDLLVNREYRKKNPQKPKEWNRWDHLRRTYNLTQTDYNTILSQQGNVCSICKTNTPGAWGVFCVDHDHDCCPGNKSCGRCIRGLLCHRCNRGLGEFFDKPEVLRDAADYLEKWKANASGHARY